MVTVEEDEWSDYGVDDDIQYAEEATSQAATARNNLNPALRSAVEQAARNVSIGAGTVAYKAPRPSRPKLGPNLYFIQGYQFFNYSRLLSARGFKRLRTLYDQIEFSDDPAKSLDSLMRVYRDWAHHFYPLYRFQDFIDKVEMHCKSNVMKVWLVPLLLDVCV